MNEIRFVLQIAADTSINVVKIGDATYNLADAEIVDGYYVITYVASPSKAADDLVITARGDAGDHEILLGLEDYASAVLADEALADAHNLVYAMVEYVELMSGKDVAVDAPEGYEAYVAAPEQAENAEGDLTLFAICHDETITFAVMGKVGANVVLTFVNGETLEAAVDENGAAVFEFSRVDLIADSFTFTVGEQTYTYSLANYIFEQSNEDVIAKLRALYNYAAYAANYSNG